MRLPSRGLLLSYAHMMLQRRILVAFIIIAAVTLTSFVPIAQADPHAVFYTTIGQQQLFFNVLAALDQADYVEPEQFRQALVQKRAEASKKESRGEPPVTTEDAVVKETRTDLSTVLTRPVTLEGDDAFTGYLAHEYAREVARRAGVTDLISRIFCHRALGREGCSNEAGEIANREFGFNADPDQSAAESIISGALAVLQSGTLEEAAALQKIATDNDTYSLGRIHNTDIASLRDKIKGNQELSRAFNSLTDQTGVSFMSGRVDPTVFDNIKLRNGVPEYAPRTDDPNFASQFFQDLSKMLFLPHQLSGAALAGQQQIKNRQRVTEAQGERADHQLLAKGQRICDNDGNCRTELTGIRPIIEVPAAAKIAQVNAITNGLVTLDSTITAATPDHITYPAGRAQLLTPGERTDNQNQQTPPPSTNTPGGFGTCLDSLDNDNDGQFDVSDIDCHTNADKRSYDGQRSEGTPQQQGNVQGIQDSAVAGTTTYNPTDYAPAPALGVSAVAPHREAELSLAIEALFPGFASTTGCGCGLEEVGNDFGTAILKKVAAFSI